jgi:hypothetical protein
VLGNDSQGNSCTLGGGVNRYFEGTWQTFSVGSGSLGHGTPYLAGNGYTGVSGEGGASLRVKAQDGSPQTDAPCLQHPA